MRPLSVERPPTAESLARDLDVAYRNVGDALDEKADTETHGRATLVGGAVRIVNRSITSTAEIHYSRMTTGGTLGHLSIAITPGQSFTINSTSATDTSVIAWRILQL